MEKTLSELLEEIPKPLLYRDDNEWVCISIGLLAVGVGDGGYGYIDGSWHSMGRGKTPEEAVIDLIKHYA